jgi:hypothetical protein
MAYALQMNGSMYTAAPTLGNILTLSTLRLVVSDFKYPANQDGSLFSQGSSTAADREVHAFVNNGNFQVYIGGTANIFGSYTSIFGSADLSGELDVTIDIASSTFTMVVGGTTYLDGVSITVGSNRVNGELFRLGARSNSATPDSSGAFFAPSGTRFGDTSIYLDGVLSRTYVSPASGTNWPDTTNSQDATVYGNASPTWEDVDSLESITITSPTNLKGFGNFLDGSNTSVTVALTYEGTPASLERSTDGGATYTDVGTPTLGAFTEVLSLPPGQYDISYRFSDSTNTQDSVTIAIGPKVLAIGHSNIVSRGDNDQTLAPSVNGVQAFQMRNNGDWRVLQDKVDAPPSGSLYSVLDDTNFGGHWLIRVANKWLAENPDIPITFMVCALSGSAAVDWQPSDSTSTLYGATKALVALAGDDFTHSIVGLGGNETNQGISYADFTPSLDNIISAMRTDYGTEFNLMPIQNYTNGRPSGDLDGGMIAIRQAIQDYARPEADVSCWPSIFQADLSTSDGTHFESNTHLEIMATSAYSSIKRGDNSCLVSVSGVSGEFQITLSSGGVTVLDEPIYLQSGTAATPGFDLDDGSAITGQITNGTDTYPLDGFVGGTLSANIAPTANAGIDQSVAAGATVQLDGTGSTDGDGTIVSYSWAQTAGDAVILTGASTSTPSFTAPSTNAQQTLTFELTVTDNEAATDTDTVDVVVAAEVVQPIESTLTATLTGIVDGTYVTRVIDTDTDTVLFSGTKAWASESASFTLSVEAGTNVEYYAYDSDTDEAGLQIGVTA